MFGLLITASAASLLASNALNPALNMLGLTNFLASTTSAAGGAAAGTVVLLSKASQVSRIALSAILALFAVDVRSRALTVEAEQPDKVFSYYMHIWNIFYACYLLLPMAKV